MKHLEDSEIEAYAAGKAGILLALRCKRHTGDCSACAARVKTAIGEWQTVADLKKAIKSVEGFMRPPENMGNSLVALKLAMDSVSAVRREDGGR